MVMRESKPAPLKVEVPVKAPPATETLEPGVIKGVGAAPGIAVGPVFHFRQVEFDLDNPETLSADGRMELSEALEFAKDQLTQLHQQMTEKKLGNEAAIFEAHQELLDDPELNEAVQARIKMGQSPVRAWKATIDEQAAAISALDDPLLAARADDLRDVGKRVLTLMLGLNEKGTSMPTTPVVVIARELSPSDTASLIRSSFWALASSKGDLLHTSRF